MPWTYEVFDNQDKASPYWQIRERYSNPEGWTDAVAAGGDTLEELEQDLLRMLDAVRKFKETRP